MKLSRLLEKVDVLGITGDPEAEVFSICYDSKRCDSSSLFVAIPGLVRDGHSYISDAVARGAGTIVHEKDFVPPPGVTAVKVANARRALGSMGKNFYRHPSAELCLVGVMGTNGKTTVTYILENIFQSAGHSVGVLGTVNYRYRDRVVPAPHTTPESLEFQRILREMADAGVTHVIAEVSSHAVDLRRVDDCAFDLGIFTNLSQDHLDYHETMEKYFQAKLRFFKEILPAGGKRPGQVKMVINGDDPWGKRIVQEAAMPSLTFGMEGEAAVRGEMTSLSAQGLRARIHLGEAAFDLASSFTGRFNLYNMLAAAAAAFALGVPERFIKEGMEGLRGVPGRLERVSRPEEPAVFVDYAHTSDALTRVLQNLSEFRRGKIITLFGCGGNRDRGKRPLMGEAAATYSDIVLITSDNPRGEDPLEIIREIEAGLDSQTIRKVSPENAKPETGGKWYAVLPDRKEAIFRAISLAAPEDTVLIAGKGHEDYQILGDRRISFDDRQVARAALEARQADSRGR